MYVNYEYVSNLSFKKLNHGQLDSTAISTRGLPPFNLWRADGSVFGVDPDLLSIAAGKLGFTFAPVVTEPLTGAPVEGSGGREWLGVVGAVKNGTSQIGIGNLAIDPARYTVVDYTAILYSLQTGYISPKPKQAPVSEREAFSVSHLMYQENKLHLRVCVYFTPP